MPKKVVIKIKGPHGVHEFTAPADFGFSEWHCCAMPFEMPEIKIRTSNAKSVREVLDGLEQMYEDLYGGE